MSFDSVSGMLITTLFLFVTKAQALTFDEGLKSQTVVGTHVISKTKPDGSVEKADTPWTETDCQKIVLSRGKDGYSSSSLIEKDEIFDAEKAEFFKAKLGEEVIARRIQFCFAKPSEASN